MADTKTSDADVRRMIALAHDAIIVGNAIDDPTYRPYCLACTGKVRMTKVEPFLWRHGCGAEHDERQVLAAMTRPPRLVPDRPSDAAVRQAWDEWCATYANCMQVITDAQYNVTRRAREIDAAAKTAEAPAERDLVERVALAIANVVGHGMAEKCEAQARAAILAMAAAPAGEGKPSDADVGRAFLTVLGDPAVAWRNTGAQPFIARVAEVCALPDAAPAAPAAVDVLSPNYEAGFKDGMKFEADQQLLTAARVTGGREAHECVERKIRWRAKELERLRGEAIQVSTTVDHIGRHETALADLYDIRAALQAANGGEG